MITYGQLKDLSEDFSIGETHDDVSDWVRHYSEASRLPPKPVQSLVGQQSAGALQQLDEAVSRFIAGPVLSYEEAEHVRGKSISKSAEYLPTTSSTDSETGSDTLS